MNTGYNLFFSLQAPTNFQDKMQAAADSRFVFLGLLLQARWRLHVGMHQSVATGGKGLLRNEKFLLNLQLLHFDLASMLPINRVERRLTWGQGESPAFITGKFSSSG